jgi:hypothetical protein
VNFLIHPRIFPNIMLAFSFGIPPNKLNEHHIRAHPVLLGKSQEATNENAEAGIAAGWMIGGSSPGRGLEFLPSSPCPDRLWGPPSLLSNGYQGFFTWS